MAVKASSVALGHFRPRQSIGIDGRLPPGSFHARQALVTVDMGQIRSSSTAERLADRRASLARAEAIRRRVEQVLLRPVRASILKFGGLGEIRFMASTARSPAQGSQEKRFRRR